jgi:hypothetical protein
MAYVGAIGLCLVCKGIFSFNPHLVPSCSAITGQREPICRDCVERVNPLRIKNGLAPIVPHPEAYEPCDESDLA